MAPIAKVPNDRASDYGECPMDGKYSRCQPLDFRMWDMKAIQKHVTEERDQKSIEKCLYLVSACVPKAVGVQQTSI